MSSLKQQLGSYGEKLAVDFLQKNGYSIIETNFRVRLGEIDIIAKHNDTLCFIEVKTRQTDLCGLPEESVAYFKQKKLSKLALTYLKMRYKTIDIKSRFDVVSINHENQLSPQVEVIANAFEFCG